MATSTKQITSTLLDAHEPEILADWIQRLKTDGALQTGRIREGELQTQCAIFLRELRQGLASGASDPDAPAFAGVRDLLGEISRSRATQGFSPRETAVFVFSLKQPL